jgi:hypothetical protein
MCPTPHLAPAGALPARHPASSQAGGSAGRACARALTPLRSLGDGPAPRRPAGHSKRHSGEGGKGRGGDGKWVLGATPAARRAPAGAARVRARAGGAKGMVCWRSSLDQNQARGSSGKVGYSLPGQRGLRAARRQRSVGCRSAGAPVPGGGEAAADSGRRRQQPRRPACVINCWDWSKRRREIRTHSTNDTRALTQGGPAARSRDTRGGPSNLGPMQTRAPPLTLHAGVWRGNKRGGVH